MTKRVGGDGREGEREREQGGTKVQKWGSEGGTEDRRQRRRIECVCVYDDVLEVLGSEVFIILFFFYRFY